MTSRERVLAAINHQQPDRTPIDVGGSLVTGIHAFAYKELCDYVGLNLGPPRVFDIFQMLAEVDEPFRQRFGIDVARVGKLRLFFGLRVDELRPWTAWNGMELLMPADFDPVEAPNGDLLVRDALKYPRGVRQAAADERGDSPGWVHEAAGGDDFVARMPRNGYYFDTIGETGMSEKLERVDPDEYARSLPRLRDDDLEFAARQARELYESTDYALLGEFFACNVGLPLSFGDSMVALATEPQWCTEILLAGAAVGVENVKLYHQAVGDRCVAWLVSGADYGSQRGELFHPDLFAELYVPAFRMVNDAVHATTTAKTMTHTCGSVRRILPHIIEAGFDIFNPVQVTAANMDARELKDKFGDRLVFWGGGVNTQGTLPEGTPEEVAEQVRERCRIFGEGGGFVFNTIHNIQARVPPANLVAMFDAARTA